jgi:hypothetical protein
MHELNLSLRTNVGPSREALCRLKQVVESKRRPKHDCTGCPPRRRPRPERGRRRRRGQPCTGVVQTTKNYWSWRT